MNRIITILFLSLIAASVLQGQVAERERFIQVDGIVYDEQYNPIPNVTIYSLKLRKGVTSKSYGVYSIISVPGDTIIFSAIGLRRTYLNPPEDITENRWLRDVVMEYDTIAINDVLVLPWGSYAEFKRAVVESDIHNQEMDNMNDNLVLIQKQILNETGVSPEVAYNHLMQQMSYASYTRNQFPSNNLLNPFAWAKFFQGLRNGLLKNERK
ncbi:MAG: hypothetical protein RBS37_04645 [Bacteroidales bacterium]|nr:hypothetical protein [Bacteroidales bacterium]